MELIDFDARFNDALNDWMEKNRKKFKRPEDMEDAAPEFYMEWLETLDAEGIRPDALARTGLNRVGKFNGDVESGQRQKTKHERYPDPL